MVITLEFSHAIERVWCHAHICLAAEADFSLFKVETAAFDVLLGVCQTGVSIDSDTLFHSHRMV